jgi:hypothetical protein
VVAELNLKNQGTPFFAAHSPVIRGEFEKHSDDLSTLDLAATLASKRSDSKLLDNVSQTVKHS